MSPFVEHAAKGFLFAFKKTNPPIEIFHYLPHNNMPNGVIEVPTDLLSNLNLSQREAVKCANRPLLVLAGAGSGKTRIIVTRIAHMIAQGVLPDRILAVTFTNKAANEMKARVHRYIGAVVAIGTFHSICLRILRSYAENIGLKTHFSILDEDDQLALIKECLKELNIDSKVIHPKYIREQINRFKDELLYPEDIKSESEYEEKYLLSVFRKYQDKLTHLNAVDFGDLILKTVRLFLRNPKILDECSDRFQHILVDEYQDTNYAQHTLINLLAGKHQLITVVGDPDQTIYEWRGAKIENILEFENIFKGAEVIRLEQNYRSTNNILKAANSVISFNKNREPKDLWSENGEGEPIQVYYAQDERDEARFLVSQISKLKKQGFRLSQMVGFYRTHAQSRVLEEELMRSRIPYMIVGGLKFYARREVKDLIAYLKVIYNPADELNLLRIINVPKRGVGPSAIQKLKDLSLAHKISLYEAIRRFLKEAKIAPKLKVALSEFVEKVEKFREASLSWPLTQLLEMVIEETGYVDELEGEATLEAKARIENIKEFFGAVMDYEKSLMDDERAQALQKYLEFISLQTDIDTWNTDGEAFAMMTLHSAKGLEFPVVFMLGMEEGLLPHMNSINGAHRQIEEERRLCYVGFTRAMKKLYVSYARIRKIFGFSRRQMPSRFLYEVPEYLLSEPIANPHVYEEASSEERQLRDFDDEEDFTGSTRFARSPLYEESNHPERANESERVEGYPDQ